MADTSLYNHQFFAAQRRADEAGHQVLITQLMAAYTPRSVLDVGCGVGHWLASFKRAGITEVHGVDGDWVPRDLLQISREEFTAMDLSRPGKLPRSFDLAISLEVGEHIDAPRARDFVRLLTSHAPVVCFSAAPPGQGGEDHINEQPPRYWRELFAEAGYVGFDWLRPALWEAAGLAYCYRQNTLLFVKTGAEEMLARSAARCADGDMAFRHVTHPDNLASKVARLDLRSRGVRPLLKALPVALWRGINRNRGSQPHQP